MPNINIYLEPKLDSKVQKEMEKRELTSKADLIIQLINEALTKCQ